MRKIIHIDMDCYYAAVEMRDNPEYRNVPLAIGGSSDRRGVISTCNYMARKFGVRSAMATAHALKLCPDLVLAPGRMELYREISQQIRGIFSRYTDKIEPLSLDEAYLDVSDCELFSGSATLIAEDIRRTIFAETQLTASAGVAPCKFVAKIASDENKPNGICVVTPSNLDDFVVKLKLGKIPGVGKVTLSKLNDMGLYTCADVRRFPFDELIKRFGKFGPVIWARSHGEDERSLTVERQRKSVGVERTMAKDIYSQQDCSKMIDSLFPKLQQRLKVSSPDLAIQSQGIKLKFSDFQQTTVEHKYQKLDKDYFFELLKEGLSRQNNRGIRLVGLHVGLLDKATQQQLHFSF
ncbi:DNA polymerase IV [Paraglaciecola aquimarina]|uniref:DNA polymerase IV n=1 Tax=Paraglaciecola aquimarina TaxID=1235557 RepID=A0ABU3SUA2_9ALTE|nr:DNA polymerase IV [Paraglaciecola aquimarina]MDU0353594.1 DNA polymerase IV [Paraglaciecola aquimarina]